LDMAKWWHHARQFKPPFRTADVRGMLAGPEFRLGDVSGALNRARTRRLVG